MFLYHLDLTTALRPSLLQDESLLYVQDVVGLYEGKYKIPQYQNGHAYLTSHRACYVDNEEPRRNSVAVNLKDVDRADFYAGFLKSSAKVSMFPKASKHGLGQFHTLQSHNTRHSPSTTPTSQSSPLRPLTPAPPPAPANINATWICPICSFSNPVPSNFDAATANARTPLPPCLACGIKPPLITVTKAALSALSNRPVKQHISSKMELNSALESPDCARVSALLSTDSIQCARCTFQNHPSLSTCEICGASLGSKAESRTGLEQHSQRSESPGPSLPGPLSQDDSVACIRFSFRAGGEKVFYERLKTALTQRKWLLQNAPPIPAPSPSPGISGSDQLSKTRFDQDARSRGFGIAGLERRGFEQMKNNEVVIGTAFEDLEALMTSAKEIIALAESFASQANMNTNGSSEVDAALSQSLSELGLATTRDKLSSKSESLYISELSRNMAEFLTDDKRGILRREGGIMTLVDLWAVFNRARGGVELVSPADFEKAAQMWDTLRLPVRLRRFKSGLLAVQGRDRTDEKTIASLLNWLKRRHHEPPSGDVGWDWNLYGRGITAQETAEEFGWSVGVATEELEMAEEHGALCRDQDFDGLRFWENRFLVEPPQP
ncbi:Vps36-domain-containing protein [Pseudovirgaria hyperparasitica]|uniref:Vacuolar protein-sorting-associated protein 36 n=1 Tax=Pseudovirgaria hyperparasitica TaxID=470096 RepID=A0A6A6WL45_9PEZI|nr:Vps36-domain-containing protein [Pseudovirgaria hyperparasitica]KAF2762930.1 Vps36-domain-containing protein [Pseudovirgaria hyperparasitica]